MSNLHVHYLLAGGGAASAAAAESIRKIDASGSIMLVGQEINRPYLRLPLIRKFLRREAIRTDLFIHPVGWYAQHHIELRTSRRVSHLDTARCGVTLDSGEEITYDKLLLATGGSATPLAIPGAQLPNVFSLRTLPDADRLITAIDKAKRDGRVHARGRGWVTVIGGGSQGAELAATLTDLGLAVDLVLGGPYPWDKTVGETTGKFLTHGLEQRRVRIHAGHRAEKIEGDGRAQRVTLTSGEMIQCDIVVAAVGVTVSKDLLRGTPVAAETAILVDNGCRTSVAEIYAAGDCAALLDPLFGKHRLLNQWDSAAITGAIAGPNMAGGQAKYDQVNELSCDAFGAPVRIWGEARLVERRLMRGTPNVESPDFVEIGVAADGRVAQVVAVAHKGEDGVLQEMVRRRIQINGNEEAFKDPSVPLQDLIGG